MSVRPLIIDNIDIVYYIHRIHIEPLKFSISFIIYLNILLVPPKGHRRLAHGNGVREEGDQEADGGEQLGTRPFSARNVDFRLETAVRILKSRRFLNSKWPKTMKNARTPTQPCPSRLRLAFSRLGTPRIVAEQAVFWLIVSVSLPRCHETPRKRLRSSRAAGILHEIEHRTGSGHRQDRTSTAASLDLPINACEISK